jgi:ABC-type cobalamin transport system ATPase subunit
VTPLITIGFGVLGFQQAQVRRRELLKSLDGRAGASKTQMDDLRSTIETRITKLDERFTALDAKIDTAVDKLEQRLPEQAATIVGQAHDFAKSARKQMRGFIRSAA